MNSIFKMIQEANIAGGWPSGSAKRKRNGEISATMHDLMTFNLLLIAYEQVD